MKLFKRIIISLVVMYLMFPFFFMRVLTLHRALVYGAALLYVLINIKHMQFLQDFVSFIKNQIVSRKNTAKNIGVNDSEYSSHVLKSPRNISFYLLSVIGILGFCLICALVIPVIYQTYDFSFLIKSVLFTLGLTFLAWLCAIFVVYNTEKEHFSHEVFLLYFVSAISLYVFFSVLFLLFPSLKLFWMNVISMNQNTRRLVEIPSYITRFGPQGYSGFRHTHLCSLAVIVSGYLIIKREQRNERFLLLFVPLVMSLAGTMFFGRVGLVNAFFSLFVFLCYSVIKKRQRLFRIALIAAVPIVLFCIMVIVQENEIFTWAIKPLKNFITTGSFNTDSVDILLKMWKTGVSFSQVIKGDGIYTSASGGYYIGVDAGFLRFLYFWGFFPTVLLYAALIGLLFKTYSSARGIPSIFLFVLLLAVNFLMFEFKGEIVWRQIVFCWCLLWLIELEKGKECLT